LIIETLKLTIPAFVFIVYEESSFFSTFSLTKLHDASRIKTHLPRLWWIYFSFFSNNDMKMKNTKSLFRH